MTNEELSISDATLIVWLREYREINEGSAGVLYDPVPECLAAADRIELLATTNEQLVATNEELTAKLSICERHRDAYAEMDRIGTQAVYDLEAKRAKAVEALIMCAGHDHDCVAKMRIARATLAEIKKPITEWPEEAGNIMVGEMKGESHE